MWLTQGEEKGLQVLLKNNERKSCLKELGTEGRRI